MATIPTNNPVPSESPRDLKFNSGKIDEFVTSRNLSYADRFGGLHHTIEGINYLAKDAISKFGYITIDSFQIGAQITLPNQALRDTTTGEYYRWDGQIPKIVPPNSTPENSGGIGIGKWLSVGDATLRGNLSSYDAGKGDSMIAVQQSFSGAGKQTAHSKFAQTCHIDDFRDPLISDDTLLQRAISGTPDGWVLKLGVGPYKAGFTTSRSNISIVGCGVPGINSDRTELIKNSGTIIQRKIAFTGSNITIESLGVDNGNKVVGDNGGKIDDALVVSNVGVSTVPNSNNHIYKVITLAYLGNSTAHSCLLENFQRGSVIDVKAYGGFVGVVCKLQDCEIDRVSGYRNTQSAVQFKSNSYAQFARNKVGFVYADDEGLAVKNSVGIFIYAEDSQLQRLSGGNFYSKGFDTGFGILQSPGTVINDINIDTVLIERPANIGFTCYGAIINTSIGTIVSSDATTGKAVHVHEDCLGINITSIQAASVSGVNSDESIYLGGVFSVGCISTNEAYIPGKPAGIKVVPTPAATTAWWIGGYIGRLLMNSTSMRNGWASARNTSSSIRLSGDYAVINAHLTVPSQRQGAELFMQANEGLRPLAGVFFPCLGFVSPTDAPISVLGAVNAAGAVYFPYLSDQKQFPASIKEVSINASWLIR
ncbi:hypothetical protein [Rouxiella sp. Mn2063]|uniref:tail fiber/spike domain-containing protein n=1 Tax=Rouxiella sp. Mn2063 TaxID=3395262 RepID=UPI003BE15FBB